jgi:predicted Zn-dependent protease
VLKRLALVYSRLGQEGKASATLVRAVDSALAAGHLDEAREMSEVAVDLDPANLLLRIRLAHVSNRQGDSDIAETHFRAAARIARGIGNVPVAQKMLASVRNLRPDDLLVRIELAELAVEQGDAGVDDVLRELVHVAVRTENYGIALQNARKRVELAGKDAVQARGELVELLRRMGDAAGELKVGKQLLDDLLERGDFEHAVELLKRLVASNSRNSDLVLHLAELINGLGDQRQSQRFYRHAVTLLQLEGRVDDAVKTLDTLERIGGEPDMIAIARDHLAKGQAIEWEAIKFSLSQKEAKKIAEDIVSMSGEHKTVAPKG